MNDNLVLEMGIVDKDNVMLLARIAEQSEQYDDMIDILKPYFELKSVEEDLSSEERNLLQVAYKNAVGLRRIAWRAAKKASITNKFAPYNEHIVEYMTRLENELVNICKDLLNLIAKHLMPRAKRTQNIEAIVYFLKLQGDYFRYVAEVSEGERHEKGVERCLKCYNEGIEQAEQMQPGDPTRLSLQLNFSIFCYESLKEQDQALEMATQAIEEAEENMGEIERSKQSESQTIKQFLKENVTQWKQKMKDTGDNSKRNLFSQNDSDAQFIEQEPLSDEDDDDDDEEY